MPSLDEFFSGQPVSRQIFEAVRQAVATIGLAEVVISKSQVAFRRRRIFARLWIPAQYLHRPAASLVLTLGFPSRDPSPRWKQIVEPAPGRFTHHLELTSPAEVDAEVCRWLQAAWTAAGPPAPAIQPDQTGP